MEDYGKYQCIVNNSFGKSQSGVALLNIDVQKPEIVEGPKNQRVSIGSNASFSCTVKGLPRPTIYWIKDNASYHLQSNPRASVIQERNANDIRSLLLITGVQKEDYGKYHCIANNSAGRKESGVVFLILGNLEKPEIVEHPKSQTYSVGSDLVFSCTATGLPKPNITWIKNNDPNVTKANPRFKTILDLDDTKCHSVLLITNATKEDAGTYQCFVNNSAGEETSNVASLHIKEAITQARLQKSSTVYIEIAVPVSCAVITVFINGVLGLWWYMRCKRGKKLEGQKKVARVHMSNGKCETVFFTQDAVEAPSLGTKNVGKVEERLLLFPVNNGLEEI